jgi:general secretion pathway protein B
MSYILDALKKLEKERKRGAVPDPLTVQDAILPEPKKRRLWPYLFLVFLLLNTGLLVWWLAPWQSPKPEVVSNLPADQRLESKEAIVSQEVEATSIGEPTTEQGDIVRQNQPVQTKSGLQEKIPRVPPLTTKTKSSHDVLPYVPKQTALTPVENKVYNLNELPPSIKQSLPTFTISISLYSDDPASRMAKINGQMLREGQYLTADVRLEEITPNEVIFSYQDYRFRVRL